MLQVPSYEEFEALQKEVSELRRDIRYLLGNQPKWMTTAQAAKALNCSRTTVFRITQAGKLNPRYEGNRPLFEVAEIRNYIQSTRVSADSTEHRILTALY